MHTESLTCHHIGHNNYSRGETGFHGAVRNIPQANLIPLEASTLQILDQLSAKLTSRSQCTVWLQSSLSNSPKHLQSYWSFTAQVRSKATDTKASHPKALSVWLRHCTHLKIAKLGAQRRPLSLPQFRPVSLCLEQSEAPAVGLGAPGLGDAHRAQGETTNFGAQNVFHWQERGAAADTPNFKLRKPTGWRPSGKKPFPGREEKGGQMRVAHRAPKGAPSWDRPRPRGPLPASSLPRVRCPGPGGRLP